MLFNLFKGAAGAVLLLASATLTSAASYSNPFENTNGGDPSIVFHNGWYYMTSTTWSDVRLRRSRTLDGLKTGEQKQIWFDTNDARKCNVWAPELHNVGGTWHVYYSAGSCDGAQRSQVLRGGSTPWDTYTHAGTINTPDWAIDGTRLTLNNQNYFVYSCFRSDTGTRLQSLCIARLTSPTTIDTTTGGINGEHLLSSPLADWERHGPFPVNEGPFQLSRNGRTWLSFSASYCGTPNYALGLLEYKSGDPLQSSSWSKTGPHFSSANGNYGTGHNSFFTSPDGKETWMAYHSTPNAQGSCGNRYANAKKITWNSDGSPNLGTPLSPGQISAGPSGE